MNGCKAPNKMKITKRQLKRIIREAITHGDGGYLDDLTPVPNPSDDVVAVRIMGAWGISPYESIDNPELQRIAGLDGDTLYRAVMEDAYEYLLHSGMVEDFANLPIQQKLSLLQKNIGNI
jgi:hypothetical protein